ncbi:MAG: iron-containing alcohol dehydrogenase [Clostridia bacterium]|nr:iron-containing alcohol dehydrogenase [Clostridia bacterium]
MKEFRFAFPVNIYFGNGELKKIGEAARELGTKALVVTGQGSMRRLGVLDRVESYLKEAGVEMVLFEGVEINPLITSVEKGSELARQEGCDLIIGVGGGSAIDAAKVIAVAAVNDGPAWNYVPSGDPGDREPQRALPIITVPTVAATGTEANRYAVITNPHTKEKPGLGHPLIYPKVSIVDPELMLSVSPRITAAGGMDVLFHALENYVNPKATPFTDMMAEKAISLVIKYLPRVYADGQDIAGRYWLALASTLAGMSNDGSGTVLLHSIEHPVSGHFNVIHGEGLCALSLAFMEYSIPGNLEKFARLPELMGYSTEGLSMEEAAKYSLKAMEDLLEKVNLNIRLRDLEVTEEILPQLARDVFKTMMGGVNNNPLVPTMEEVVEIYRKAL